MSVSMLSRHLEEQLLLHRAELPMFRHAESVAGNDMATLRLQKLNGSLTKAALSLTEDGADAAAMGASITRLKQARTEARTTAREHLSTGLIDTGQTVGDIWRRCTSDLQCREVFAGQVERLAISRGTSSPVFSPLA